MAQPLSTVTVRNFDHSMPHQRRLDHYSVHRLDRNSDIVLSIAADNITYCYNKYKKKGSLSLAARVMV